MTAPDAPPSAPPPPPSPGPAPWTPPSGPYAAPTPAPSMTQRFSPESLGQRLPWAFFAFAAYSIGLLLLFVGGLVAVTGGVYPPSCYASTSCGASSIQNVYWGIMVARLLLVLGLFGIAVGAGLHLQFSAEPAPGAGPEATRVYISRRRFERVLLGFTVLLLFVLVWWAATTPA